MKRIVLVTAQEHSASTYYRKILPLRHCRQTLLGEGISLEDASEPHLDWMSADAAVFYRHMPLEDYPVIMDFLIRQKPTYWDGDDHLLALPIWNKESEKFTQKQKMMYRQVLMLAHGLSVSTIPLAEEVGFDKKVDVLPNLIDEDDWGDVPEPRVGGPVHVAWVGPASHDLDIEPALEALLEVRSYCDQDQVKIIAFGHTPTALKTFKGLDVIPLSWVPVRDYPRVLRYVRPHILIAPLLDEEESDRTFNRCRSGNKYFEASMVGALFVGQDLEPYQDVGSNCTRVLCGTKDEWTDVLLSTIDNVRDHPEDVCRVVVKARKDVLANHSWTGPGRDLWLDHFRKIAAEIKS